MISLRRLVRRRRSRGRSRSGPIALLRVLANNPIEAWTAAHFEQPIVMSGMSMGRVAVVSDPAAIRRVLLENCDNYQKDWLQRRVLSAGLTGGLLTAKCQNWRMQRRAMAPLFARKTVMNFSAAMIDAASRLVDRLAQREGQVTDSRSKRRASPWRCWSERFFRTASGAMQKTSAWR